MLKIGFVPSHRSPFDRDWAADMRKRTIKAINERIEGIEIVYPDESLTDGGLITFQEDAYKAVRLFKEKDIKGLIIGTMTFGEELPNLTIAEAFDNIPILLFGTKEGPFTADGNRRSDSFCGTISTAAGLSRRKIKFHFAGIYFPEEEGFIQAVTEFSKAVLTYNDFLGARIGMIGPRPAPFETCAINEISLISKFRHRIIPFNLLKVNADLGKITDKQIEGTVGEIRKNYDCTLVEGESISTMAKLEYLLREYAQTENISGYGIQCWTSMQEEIGISPCLAMGRLTDSGIMCACEVDIHGALTMLVQYLASFKKTVPHFIDWTIQHQEDENSFLAWHCGNAPASLRCSSCKPVLNSHSILGRQIGYEKSFGTAEFQLKEGEVTLARLGETDGRFRMLIAKGEAYRDDRNLRGSWKWIRVKDLAGLYRTIIEEGFIHHASMIFGDRVKEIELFCKFADIEVVSV
ncbi:MAG: L-fucose/L-arabinose isomerase family protein [Actinomycetota bacterium]